MPALPANDDHLPATRGDLRALGDELRGEMNSLREDMIEAIRDAQTELLRAFHGYATSVGARISVGEAHDAAFAARLSALEDRVLALETRPPRP